MEPGALALAACFVREDKIDSTSAALLDGGGLKLTADFPVDGVEIETGEAPGTTPADLVCDACSGEILEGGALKGKAVP